MDFPQITSELRDKLASWRGEVGARMPTPNPHYDDIVAGRLPRPNGAGRFPPGTPIAPPEQERRPAEGGR